MSDTHSENNATRDSAKSVRDAEHERIAALERFARRAFAEDVERVDVAARSRLASARRQAVDARPRSFVMPWHATVLRTGPGWAVAGGAAALVLAIALALRSNEPEVVGADTAPLVADDRARATIGSEPAATGARIDLIASAEALATTSDLELLAGGELDVLENDLEFYAWLEQQPELAVPGEGRGR